MRHSHHIALPAGATTPEHWSRIPDSNGLHCRAVEWWEKHAQETTVAIHGLQYSDGTVEHAISIYLETNASLAISTAAEAREIAALLTEAAADVMTGAFRDGAPLLTNVAPTSRGLLQVGPPERAS